MTKAEHRAALVAAIVDVAEAVAECTVHQNSSEESSYDAYDRAQYQKYRAVEQLETVLDEIFEDENHG